MFDSAQDSPGEWFNCLNIGDDYELEADRRSEENLVIPGFSVVEIVGIRKINDDHFVHEVRLNRTRTVTSIAVDADTVGSSSNQAFTGPGDILKGFSGRIKFAPAMCRFTGNEADTDKIYGRYKAPERRNGGMYTSAEYDAFEEQERLFGQGKRVQLLGSPDGSLKLPSGDDNSDQQFLTGWDVLGVYKYHTGEKTKGKKDDDDKIKNLLVMVSPAASAPPPSVIFLTKESITNEVFQAGSVSTDFLEYIDPRSARWNHKMLLDFTGVFGHEYAFEIIDGYGNIVGPFLISTDGTDIQAALESLWWVGTGNVTVHTPGQQTGRYIIEFVNDLAGVRVSKMYWQRVITIDNSPPANLLNGTPDIPPILQYELLEYDYRLLPGVHRVQITPASKSLTPYQRWYGGGYGYYNGWGYGYGYYPGGDYGYYGGWDNGYYGPNGYDAAVYAGPFNRDEDGNVSPVGTYNAAGYNENGYNKDGYDPAGFDINGLNADGETWGYYGVWGHLHTGLASHNQSFDHKNDHGIVNYYANNVYQHTAAGSFGVANWVEGGGYVVTELEQREFWMHVEESTAARLTTY